MRWLLIPLLCSTLLVACGGGSPSGTNDGEKSPLGTKDGDESPAGKDDGKRSPSSTISADFVAQDVRDYVQETTGVTSRVRCTDDGEAAVVDMVVRCDVRNDRGARVVAKVTVTAVDRAAREPIKVFVDVPLHPTELLQADAERQLRADYGAVELDCPGFVGIDRKSFDCAFTAPAARIGYLIRAKPLGGDSFDFDVIRP